MRKIKNRIIEITVEKATASGWGDVVELIAINGDMGFMELFHGCERERERERER